MKSSNLGSADRYNQNCTIALRATNGIRLANEKVELPKHVEEHMLEVLEVYGRHNSFYLERMTQDEDPWRKARRGIPIGEPSTEVISKRSMQKYYKNLLEDEEEETQASESYKAAS